MKATLICLLLIASTSASAQSRLKDIKGVWRGYSSLQDTADNSEGGLYLIFDGKNMGMAMAMGGMVVPLGDSAAYTFRNDTLIQDTFKMKITVFSQDFIAYKGPDNQVMYLKRQKE